MLPFNSPTSTPPRMKNRKPKESMSFEQSGSRCHATNLPDSWNRDPITQNLDSSSWWACTTRGLRTVQPPCISICDGQRRHLRSGYRTPPRDKQNFNHEENLREAQASSFCSGDVRYVPRPTRYFESRIREVGEHDETLDHDVRSAEHVPGRPQPEYRFGKRFYTRFEEIES